MAKRTKIAGVAVKIQPAPGVDSVPTWAANAVRPIGTPTLARNYLDEGSRDDEQHGGMGTIGKGRSVGRWGQFDLTLAAKGAGADYFGGVNRPEWDVPLRAAGFSATESGGAGAGIVTYTTLDAGVFELFTAYVITHESKLYKLIDCIALPKFSAEAAKRGTFTFTIMGRMVSDPSELTLGAQTLSTVTPPPFVGNTVAIGAYTSALPTNPLVPRKIDLDFGTTQTPSPSAGAADGHAGFTITDRSLDCSMDIEQVPRSAFDPDVVAAQASVGGIDTKVSFQLGSAPFNRVKFALGQWLLVSPADNDASGIGTYQLKGKIAARSLAQGREITIIVD